MKSSFLAKEIINGDSVYLNLLQSLATGVVKR